MKRCLLHIALLALLIPVLRPATADASTVPAFDYEQWRRDHPRPSAKRLSDLNVGEPRTVRMIYFLPSDRAYQEGVVDSMKTMIRRLQGFYAEQMEAHGYGPETFQYETDDQGEPLVHRLDGQNPDSHYVDGTFDAVFAEIEQTFDVSQNVYFVLIDNSIHEITTEDGSEAGGAATSIGKSGGVALFSDEFTFGIAAHELTHAFGPVWHDFNSDAYVLSYGSDPDQLSLGSAHFLSVHPYFNADVATESAPGPAIELVSPRTYATGSTTVSVQLRLDDAEGLHQVYLLVVTGWFHGAAGSNEVKEVRRLAGEEEALVEFEYDGSTPSNVRTHLSNPLVHAIQVAAVDTDGNIGFLSFDLLATSPQHLATLEGDGLYDHSVAFSPDGNTLASGTQTGVELWDAETQDSLAFLQGTGPVAFAPDGTLASGGRDRTIRLWDVESSGNTGVLTGHAGEVRSLAFAPGGATLASGSFDGEVRLWDVATETGRTILEGSASVESMSISPDGNMLALTQNQVINLWDLELEESIASLSGHESQVFAVAFSPDGSTLASASLDGTVKLWDVETREDRATLEQSQAASVAFPPGGATLASGSLDGTIRLWDLVTEQPLGALAGHTEAVLSLAFSPDGSTLASASEDHSVKLWDASEWTGPRPVELVKISGDNQQAAPDEELADPFVVEVRDQHGNPLAGAEVTFAVTGGDGTLGSRLTNERKTTDADGRTESSLLNLGPAPGTNTVEVSAGPAQSTFTSVGVGTPVASPGGDHQTWHLPDGAIARLGKGRLSQGERAIALTPGGEKLAAVSSIGIWLYDVETLQPLAHLPTARNSSGSVDFSPDGTKLAVSPGDQDPTTRIWDIATGEVLTQIEEPTASAAVFSPDGTQLASGLWDGTIKLWDVATGTEAATLEGHDDGVSSVSFSPDGSMLASGSWDRSIKLWDLASRTETATLEGHADVVASVSFSPDGRTLASGSWDGTLRLWDLTTETHSILERTAVFIESLSFSPDGSILASVSHNKLRLWDVATETSVTLEGHRLSINTVSFSDYGTTLASGSWADGTIRRWDLASGNSTLLRGHFGGISSLAFSPNGSVLASGTSSHTIELWDTATRANAASLEGYGGGASIAFSPDGATLASASGFHGRLWDVAAGGTPATLKLHTNAVLSLGFAPDGTLASAAADNTVALWDTEMGTSTDSFDLEAGLEGIWSASFSPSARHLATGSLDGSIKLWDAATGGSTATLSGHELAVFSLAFSADGAILASGSDDQALRLWDVATGAEIRTLSEQSRASSLSFSPDGTMLAAGLTGYEMNPVEVWDLEAGSSIAALLGHRSSVTALAFSPDGSICASGSPDGTVLLWDVRLILPHARTLTRISGDEQEATSNAELADPLVVEVRDQNGDLFEGARVTFAVTAGDGTLSTSTATTDARGRASTTLTLGEELGAYMVEVVVEAAVAEVERVSFTATARANPDFDGDGEVGFADFFLFAEAFGGSDPRFDLDASGDVDFADFFLFAESFGRPERAKLLALARDRIGLPEGPQLQQNAPNPFNGQTVIPWFLLQEGPARLEVYALTGQRVAVLSRGPHKAGLYRFRWDGRDDQGRPLASGVYLYRLVTSQGVHTRKLTLLR